MEQINWGIVISLASLVITVFTIIYSNAKSSEHTNSRIDVIEAKLEYNNNEITELKTEVHKNNELKDRMSKAEGRLELQDERYKVTKNRLKDAEDDIKTIQNKMTRSTSV